MGLLVDPEPVASPVQPVKTWRVPLWVMIMLLGKEATAAVPVSYHPVPVVEPSGEVTVRWYCSCQLNVIVWFAWMLVNVWLVPETGGLPSTL